jgi:hypothetical protein
MREPRRVNVQPASLTLPSGASLLLAPLDLSFTKLAVVEDDDVLGAWLHDSLFPSEASLAADQSEQHARPPTCVHPRREGS